MKQQTAIEWFNQQIIDKQIGNGNSRSWDEIFEQAKEMEKQQIIDAFLDGITPSKENVKEAEQYYKETFK